MEETDTVVEIQDENLTISRTDKPDYSLKLDTVEHETLYDENEQSIRFGDLYKNQKALIIFVRHFLCFMAKEYLDDLAKVKEAMLKQHNVNLVIIGCAPCKFIKAMRCDTRVTLPFYCDPDRVIYKKLGLHERATADSFVINKSRHVKSGFIMGTLKSTWRGMRYKESQGDMNQQGASLIVSPNKEIHYFHRDKYPSDHRPINDLLCLAGVSQVNYDNDRRVMSV